MAKQTHNPQANSGLRAEAVCCSRTNTLDKESCVGALHPAAIAKFSVRDLLSGASFGNRPHHNNGTFRGPNCPLNGGSLPAARLLAMLAEGYRKQQFPKSPELNPSAIAIVDSSTSFLVQAADVVGNFSMNYVIRNLASTTASRTKKAEIFDSVFHDLLPQTTQFGKLASLTAPQLELALNQAGALTNV